MARHVEGLGLPPSALYVLPLRCRGGDENHAAHRRRWQLAEENLARFRVVVSVSPVARLNWPSANAVPREKAGRRSVSIAALQRGVRRGTDRPGGGYIIIPCAMGSKPAGPRPGIPTLSGSEGLGLREPGPARADAPEALSCCPSNWKGAALPDTNL